MCCNKEIEIKEIHFLKLYLFVKYKIQLKKLTCKIQSNCQYVDVVLYQTSAIMY
jgi:hypothetical protein